MKHKITIQPDGKTLFVEGEKTIRSALIDAGFFFPQNCGGKGQCGRCRVLIQDDPPTMNSRELEILGENSPYRLACLHRVNGDLVLSLPGVEEWAIEKSIAGFDVSKTESDGFGVAIDLGTTIMALYLLDFTSGKIIAQSSILNPQTHLGSDVMTRLNLAKDSHTRQKLTSAVHRGLTDEISALLLISSVNRTEVKRASLVGNTAMAHMFLGMAGEGLEIAPFRSPLEKRGRITFQPEWIGMAENCVCDACPVIESFIGGDTTAAILAAEFDQGGKPRLLIDLGTNGEIVLANGTSLLAASTAAGPAFDGVGMHSGMPAVKGAIEGLDISGNPFVIGGGEPRGFCGSGYISAFARLLKKNLMDHTGLLKRDDRGMRRWSPFHQSKNGVAITQDDVRKFQLAKGAIAAGIEILIRQAAIAPEALEEIIITGSFGNRIDPQAAMEVGLIPPLPLTRIKPLDNAAGRGALLCLVSEKYRQRATEVASTVQAVNLANHPDFQDIFINNMQFNINSRTSDTSKST